MKDKNNISKALANLAKPLSPDAREKNSEFAKDLIAEITRPLQEAVHPNLMGVTNMLVRKGMADENDLRATLRDAGHRQATEAELNNVIKKALSKDYKGGTHKPWSEFDPELQKKIIAESTFLTFDDLTKKWGRNQEYTTDILSELFTGDDFVVLGKDRYSTTCKLFKEWEQGKLELEAYPFFIPAIMKSEKGLTQNGDLKGRSKANVLRRILLIVEFDKNPHSEQVALIAHLAQFAPLRYVLDSGNKSLHAGVEVRDMSEKQLREFMDYAVRLGADTALFTLCQFARTPGATRDNGNEQKVIVYRSEQDTAQDEWHLDLLPKQKSNTRPPGADPSTPPILADIIHHATHVDFQELAITSTGERLVNADGEDRPPRQKEAVVLICDHLHQALNTEESGMALLDGRQHLYDGSHWLPLTDDALTRAAGAYAEALGYSPVDARFFRTREMLLHQLKGVSPSLMRHQGASMVNFTNGTLELSEENERLRLHAKTDGLTYVLPFDYDPRAKSPMFDKYLDRVLPDEECQTLLCEFYGWVFLRELKLEKMLILLGHGHNGKSVLFDVMGALLGSENISNIGLDALKTPEKRVPMVGKLLNYGSEITGNVSPDTIKKASSGEHLEFRYLYGDLFTSDNYARLAFNANTLPSEVEHTEGFFRRFTIIPFNEKITAEEKDPELARKIITSELPGVMNWVIRGMCRVRANRKFSSCKKSDECLAEFRHEADTVSLFIEEEGYFPTRDNRIKQADLYTEYSCFCSSNGFKSLNRKHFKHRLESNHNITGGKHGDIGRFWHIAAKEKK